jgi:hypothetical protein
MRRFLVIIPAAFAQIETYNYVEYNYEYDSTPAPIEFPGPDGIGARLAGFKCMTCNEATVSDCLNNLVEATCPDHQESCEVTLHERYGEVKSIQMGCKETKACRDNQVQNFVGSSFQNHQCKPWFHTHPTSIFVRRGYPSVCRMCCTASDHPTGNCFGDIGSGLLGWSDVNTITHDFLTMDQADWEDGL